MNIFIKTVTASLIALFMVTSLVADESIPGAKQANPVLLKGGTIHTMSGDTIEDGNLLFVDGKITKVSGKKISVPDNTETVDVSGKHIYPGLFEAHSQMGLIEISAVRATVDTSETGSINPNVKAQVSVNPDNMVIPVTRAGGVLLALTAPSGGLVSGKSAVLQLDGWTYEDMTVRANTAMHINWPSQTISPRRLARMDEDAIKEFRKEQAGQLVELKDLFKQARSYRDGRADKNVKQAFDLRQEAMVDVIDGKIPLMVRADGAAEIQSAVLFAVDQKVKIIILGGYDAPMCADLLKKHEVPVIVSAVYRLPRRRDEAFDAAYTLPERLREAGIKFCISGTDRSETWNARILPYHAATAVAYGLDAEEAMKAITIYPAQILGVADRVGSLEKGKDATLIVTDGSPLETTTNILQAFINGRAVDLSSRHTRLYEKYQKKYEQLENEK